MSRFKKFVIALAAVAVLAPIGVVGANGGFSERGVPNSSLNGNKGVANLSIGERSLKPHIVNCQKLSYDVRNSLPVCNGGYPRPPVTGPAGPAGPAGADGAVGATGPQGPAVSTSTLPACVITFSGPPQDLSAVVVGPVNGLILLGACPTGEQRLPFLNYEDVSFYVAPPTA